MPGRKQGEYVLFCRERNPEREIWDGFRYGPEGACSHFGADDAYPIDDIDDILPGLIEGRKRVYYALGQEPSFDSQVMGWVNHIRSRCAAARYRRGVYRPQPPAAQPAPDQKPRRTSRDGRLLRLAARAHVRAMRFVNPACLNTS